MIDKELKAYQVSVRNNIEVGLDVSYIVIAKDVANLLEILSLSEHEELVSMQLFDCGVILPKGQDATSN